MFSSTQIYESDPSAFNTSILRQFRSHRHPDAKTYSPNHETPRSVQRRFLPLIKDVNAEFNTFLNSSETLPSPQPITRPKRVYRKNSPYKVRNRLTPLNSKSRKRTSMNTQNSIGFKPITGIKTYRLHWTTTAFHRFKPNNRIFNSVKNTKALRYTNLKRRIK